MNILFQTYAFHPSVGGIESSAQFLIEGFLEMGHSVRVMTATPLGGAPEVEGVEVIRSIHPIDQIRHARWADLVFQHNPSLNMAISSFLGKPLVASIQTWIARTNGRIAWMDGLKKHWLSHHTVISNSSIIAEHLGFPSTVIPNAYNDKDFINKTTWAERSGAVFVGRLVSDKGADIAIRALAELDQAQNPCTLDVIGDGPERERLEALCCEYSLEQRVRFHGSLKPPQVANILNQRKYLLIPSRWVEPFGIVALEGIACGCIPIIPNQGGLIDATGPCGPQFESGSAEALASSLLTLEQSPSAQKRYLDFQKSHLSKNTPKEMALRYLDVFEQALER